MVGLQTLDLAIGVRVPASQPKHFSDCKRAVRPEDVTWTFDLPAWQLISSDHLRQVIVSNQNLCGLSARLISAEARKYPSRLSFPRISDDWDRSEPVRDRALTNCFNF